MRQQGYITIEEESGAVLHGIAPLIVDEFPNMELSIMEDTSYYFVIKFFCDDFAEVQELISTIAYILCGESIHKYTTTLNCNE